MIKRISIALFCICLFCAWNGWNGRISRPYVRQSVFVGYTDVTTNMTANNLPAPLITAASSELTAPTYSAYKCFDNVSTSSYGWLSAQLDTNHCWIKYDWGTNRSYTIQKYNITASHRYNERTPHTWYLWGSNNGGARVQLDYQAGYTFTSNETKSFEIPNTSEYRYYLLDVVRVGDGADNDYTSIQEIRWFKGVYE